MDPENIPAKFEVRSFTRSSDNRGYSKKFGQSIHTPMLSFLQNFSWVCVRMDTVNVSAKFAVHSFSRSWDNSDCSFGVGVVNPESWRRGGRRESGMAPLERALVTSYRLSIVTFPLSLRVSEILPLLFSSTPSHP